MTPRSFVFFMRRRWKKIILLMLLTTIFSTFFAWQKNKIQYAGTIFLSIGVKQSEEDSGKDMYEKVQAADQFTETIQGWFKNPNFIDRVNKAAGNGAEFSARKQEKQNVVVTFVSDSDEQAKKLIEVIKSELSAEIQKFNTRTNSNFQLALYSGTVSPQDGNFLLFIIFGTLLGLILGLCLAYAYEYFFNLASFEKQITDVLQKNYLEKLPKEKSKKLSLLVTYLKNLEAKKITLAGVNFLPTTLQQNLAEKLPQKQIHSLNLPQQSEELKKVEHLILVCRLGKTKLEDLQKLEIILSQNFDLLILQM
jgi:capsular polysaccharide biosynthesis protein